MIDWAGRCLIALYNDDVCLSRAKDNMGARVTVDDVAQLANLQCDNSVFERLLHVSRTEPVEIAALRRRAAVAELARNVSKGLLPGRNAVVDDQRVLT